MPKARPLRTKFQKSSRRRHENSTVGPFATFNVAVLIHSFVHIGCALGTTILFLYSKFIIYFIYETHYEQNFKSLRAEGTKTVQSEWIPWQDIAGS
jgi:hypothetical protein